VRRERILKLHGTMSPLLPSLGHNYRQQEPKSRLLSDKLDTQFSTGTIRPGIKFGPAESNNRPG